MEGPDGSKRRLPEVIADQLQEEIVHARLPPEHRLPTEVELAERYSVSRTVVREAARLLVERGLVTVKPGRGMVVAEFDGRFIAEQFAFWMRASNGSFDQLLELRLALEVQMATLAAERPADEGLGGARDELIAAMQDTITRGQAAVEDRTAFLDADLAFHELLAAASDNPFFDLVSKPINTFLRGHYEHRSTYPSDPRRTLEEHQEILRAIAQRDTLGARHAMEEHLRRLLRSRRPAWVLDPTARTPPASPTTDA
jgi:GntR family transcriptional repressor for pyruvate dehydrogenase complex